MMRAVKVLAKILWFPAFAIVLVASVMRFCVPSRPDHRAHSEDPITFLEMR
jgi:hypothetical protein